MARLHDDLRLEPGQHARPQLSWADCAPAVQAAVTHNTKPIVARRMAGARAQITRELVPHGAVLSPCNQLVAWIMSRGVMVQHCCGRSQVASVTMPAHSQASNLTWSQASSHLAVWCNSEDDQDPSVWDQYILVLEVASGRAHKVLLSQSRLAALPLPELTWAPTAPRLAVFYTNHSLAAAPRRLCLVDAAGSASEIVCRMELPHCTLPLWCSDSRALAFCGSNGFGILDAASHQLYEVATVRRIVLAWSPSTWRDPHLLWLTDQSDVREHSATARLFRATAQRKGVCGFPILEEAAEMVWGQQGLAVLQACGLWLGEVLIHANWLQIKIKHFLEPPVPVCGLLLSPDEQYLGGFRVAYEGFGDMRCHSSC